MGITMNLWTRDEIEAAIETVEVAGEDRHDDYFLALRAIRAAFRVKTTIVEGEKAGEDRVVMVGRWPRELPE